MKTHVTLSIAMATHICTFKVETEADLSREAYVPANPEGLHIEGYTHKLHFRMKGHVLYCVAYPAISTSDVSEPVYSVYDQVPVSILECDDPAFTKTTLGTYIIKNLNNDLPECTVTVPPDTKPKYGYRVIGDEEYEIFCNQIVLGIEQEARIATVYDKGAREEYLKYLQGSVDGTISEERYKYLIRALLAQITAYSDNEVIDGLDGGIHMTIANIEEEVGLQKVPYVVEYEYTAKDTAIILASSKEEAKSILLAQNKKEGINTTRAEVDVE